MTEAYKSTAVKTHPFIAAFFDFYILSFVIVIILSFFMRLFSSMLSADYVFLLFLISLFIVIIYHVKWSGQFKYLTAGEMVTGKNYVHDKKIWENPYKKNRWSLFTIIIFTVLILGSDINNLVLHVDSFGLFFAQTIRIALLFFGMILLGRGKVKASWLLMAVFTLGWAFSYMVYYATSDIFMKVLAYFNLVMSAFYLLIYLSYRKTPINQQ